MSNLKLLNKDCGNIIKIYFFEAFRGSVAESLQEVDLLVVDTETCKRVYKDSRFPINEDLMFCAGHVEGGKDSCQGAETEKI